MKWRVWTTKRGINSHIIVFNHLLTMFFQPLKSALKQCVLWLRQTSVSDTDCGLWITSNDTHGQTREGLKLENKSLQWREKSNSDWIKLNCSEAAKAACTTCYHSVCLSVCVCLPVCLVCPICQMVSSTADGYLRAAVHQSLLCCMFGLLKPLNPLKKKLVE